MINKIAVSIIIICTIACTNKNNADIIIYNANIYTVDSNFSVVEAIVINNKKIIATGKSDSLLKIYNCKQTIDAKGKTILPGLIDAHAHFLGYGLQLNTVNLIGTKSWDEVIERVQTFYKEKSIKKGEWITGRGWDQNDWANKNFPNNIKLNKLFGDNPILLTRIDGHAAIANDLAQSKANILPNQQIIGGTIESVAGELTGLLIDNAVDLVQSVIPQPSKNDKVNALLQAQKNCFAVGLTTIDDCGINADDAELMMQLQNEEKLQMKIYAMLSDASDNYAYLIKKGKIQSPNFTITGFKVYGDGALGSRGACLLNPYHDRPNEQGFLLSSLAHFDSIAKLCYNNAFQMCTHAIGDSANRSILNIYAKYLKGKNDLRWRIEHAQVVSPIDFAKFGQFNIIPSVQPTHATSDMYWAAQRLGSTRENGAYAYQQLLQQNKWIPLGTDFPVEDISPFKTFYAATIRKDANNFPANGYQIENALTRVEALKGMTIWAAKSNFEENLKGSLEIGKYADFIIVDNDLIKCAPDKILNTKVNSTWINGAKVWGS